jgi:hypothetical protein
VSHTVTWPVTPRDEDGGLIAFFGKKDRVPFFVLGQTPEKETGSPLPAGSIFEIGTGYPLPAGSIFGNWDRVPSSCWVNFRKLGQGSLFLLGHFSEIGTGSPLPAGPATPARRVLFVAVAAEL